MRDVLAEANSYRLSLFPTSAYYARVHVQRVLEGWGRDDLVETARLVISELVSNAIKASASCPAVTDIWMDVYRSGRAVVLRVWDAGRTPPIRQSPGPDDEGGRGLYLVDLLASDWGYYWPADGGKIVWCSLKSPI